MKSVKRSRHPVEERVAAPPPRGLLALERTAEIIPLFTLAVVAVLVIPGTKDPFRFPKEIVVRAAAIVLVMLWGLLALSGRRIFDNIPAAVGVALIAPIVWTAFTAAIATNRALSAGAFAWAAAVAIVAAATYTSLARRRRFGDLWYVIVPALINAPLAIAQDTGFWNPFAFAETVPERLRTTALIGNPNDVGVVLVIALIAAAAGAIAADRHRWLFVGATILLIAGVGAARTATATAGCAAGLIALAISGAQKKRIAAGILFVIATIAAALVLQSSRFDREDMRRMTRIEVLNEHLSFRVPPFLAAWRMFKDHPVAGVGPGCWSYHYFDYKMDVERDYPSLFLAGQSWSNFGEVHNDHLEVLAETGIPGYMMLLAICAFVTRTTFRTQRSDSSLENAARLLAFPSVAAFFVMALAQFPMQLAAPTMSLVFVFATALAWSRA